jgi:hypothetical protein
MTSAKRKFDWLKTKRLWGAESPDNKKIVAMTAALNPLKGQFKLDPKLSAIANERKATRGTRRRTRRTLATNGNRRRMKPGRKSRQRTVRSTRKKWANTCTTGVSTTWRGPCTSLPTASWASSARKTRRRSRRRRLPTPLTLLPPLQRQ